MFDFNLKTYLNSYCLLDIRQHGFSSGQSTVTNLLGFDKHIVKHLNDGRPCDVILIDLSRAFNKVSHQKLRIKLKCLGIDGCYLKWIVNYFSNRKQYVTYSGWTMLSRNCLLMTLNLLVMSAFSLAGQQYRQTLMWWLLGQIRISCPLV
jgi:hypothetical protein